MSTTLSKEFNKKYYEKLDKVLQSTQKLAECLMEDYQAGRTSKIEHDLGFNLKVTISLYYGQRYQAEKAKDDPNV